MVSKNDIKLYIENLLDKKLDIRRFSQGHSKEIFPKFKDVFSKEHQYWDIVNFHNDHPNHPEADMENVFYIKFRKLRDYPNIVFLKFSFFPNVSEPKRLYLELKEIDDDGDWEFKNLLGDTIDNKIVIEFSKLGENGANLKEKLIKCVFKGLDYKSTKR